LVSWKRGLIVPFFPPAIQLRLGLILPKLNVIERAFHHQPHAVRHSAQAQCHRAAGAVEVVGQVGGEGADGEQVFGGVGHEGFGVGVGAEGEQATQAFWAWGAGFEMVVEGAFGGFVEFFESGNS